MLGDDKPDDDAMTRGQQKQIEALTKEVPPSPSKKAKMAKHTTMVGTAKVSFSGVGHHYSVQNPAGIMKSPSIKKLNVFYRIKIMK